MSDCPYKPGTLGYLDWRKHESPEAWVAYAQARRELAESQKAPPPAVMLEKPAKCDFCGRPTETSECQNCAEFYKHLFKKCPGCRACGYYKEQCRKEADVTTGFVWDPAKYML